MEHEIYTGASDAKTIIAAVHHCGVLGAANYDDLFGNDNTRPISEIVLASVGEEGEIHPAWGVQAASHFFLSPTGEEFLSSLSVVTPAGVTISTGASLADEDGRQVFGLRVNFGRRSSHLALKMGYELLGNSHGALELIQWAAVNGIIAKQERPTHHVHGLYY